MSEMNGAVRRSATLGDSITAGTTDDDLNLRPQLVTEWLATHSPEVRLATGDHGVLCIDLAAWSRRYSDGAYDADGVHPSQIGHRRIAIAMTLVLSTQLELPDARSYWEASER